jgi:hypothetical protein
MPRLSADQWETVRAEREAGASLTPCWLAGALPPRDDREDMAASAYSSFAGSRSARSAPEVFTSSSY